MLEHEKDRQLNARLDSLLSAYSAVEPRPGLETRIRAGLSARAARRRRGWMLIFAAAAAVVVLVALIAKVRRPQPSGPDHVAVHKSSPDAVSAHAEAVSPAPQKTTGQFANHRRAKAPRRTNSRILLEVADALHQADHVVFEREKLYLAPTPQQEPEAQIEPQTSAPRINVQDLGVQTIEIKELPSQKGMDSKGNL